MADINGTDNDDVIRTVAAGGSLGGLPDATDAGDTIIAGAGNDTIIAGSGDDVIDAGDGDDIVDAGDGNDIVAGGDGVDVLDGGDGWDTLDFTNAPGGVAFVLGQGDVFNDGYGNTETGIVNFEYAYGSMHDDFMAGGPGFNVLFGQDGDDSIYGGAGPDILYGQAGSDLLVGEEGADTLYGDGAGGAEDDVLVGGRNDIIGPNGQRADDFETDTLYGGGGNDTLVLGVGDFGHGEAGDDRFEFAIDINTPLDQQPLAVGTAVFSGDRAEYDIFIDNGRLIVEHLMLGPLAGSDGRDDVGLAFLTPGLGPQIVAFLQFADQTVDVLNDIPGIGGNLGPDVPSFGLSLDANTSIGANFFVSDPEGSSISFIGWTGGPSDGTLSDIFFDDFLNEFIFTYSPNAGFIGTDSVTFLFQDAFGAQGSGTITFDVLLDSAVADVFTVGVGRSFTGQVGLNDADINGNGPVSFALLSSPDNFTTFSFDSSTGAFIFTPADASVFSTQFGYRATFPDGTSDDAPVFINFIELAEVLIGTPGDDTIFGYGLDDVITGGPGNDTIIGGGGVDTAVFSGVLAGYALVQTGMRVVVTDIDPTDGDDGTDTVLAEFLRFADQTIQVVNNFDPLAGTVDGRLVNTLGGAAGFGENVLFRNDDSSSAGIDIASLFGGPLNFYAQPLTQVFVNNNGNLTFTEPFGGYISQPLGQQVNFAIIAGAWSDLDTRRGPVPQSPGGNSTGSNLVYWDFDEVNQTFTATWDDVAPYYFGSFPVASFQVQLVGRGGGDFDIVYRYEFLQDGRVARAGFANQDDTAIFELPGSGSGAAGQLDTIAGNTGLPGVWVFSVRQGAFAPTGAPDTYSTIEDTPLVVAGPGVLANDADPLGRPLTAVLSTNPAHGSIVFNTDGGFTYTPFADFNGTDSFTYQAVADSLGSGVVTVSISVAGVNDAPRNIGISNSSTPENLVSGVNTGTNVLVGTLSAFDPESPMTDLAFQLINDAGGRFLLNGRDLRTNGVLDYETATFHDIVVRVTDPQGAFTAQSIRIFVQNINEGPTDIFLTGPGAIYENLPPGTFIGRLSSNDAEGDPITYTRFSGPVNIVGDEVFTSLSFDFEFQTQFTFTVRAAEPSGDGVTRQFTIFIDNVNEQPTANSDFATVVAGDSVDIFILGNDTDPDRDPLLVQDFTNPANGTVTLFLTPTDLFTYTPNPGFIGTDFFTYSVIDPGGLISNTAIVTIIVRPGDVIATADFVTTDEESPVFIDVLRNDFLRLPDGTVVPQPQAGLLLEGWENPAHGSLTLDVATETFLYTPNRDFYGRDFFTYRATDGYGVSQTVRVDIAVFNVNDDPYQTYIPEFLAVENRPFFGTLQGPNRGITSIFDPDIWPTPDSLGVAPGTFETTQGGTVKVYANKTFDYTPPQAFDGYDSFTITYNDFAFDPWTGQEVAQGGAHTMLVRINVEGEEPVAVDDRYTITVGQSINGMVLANDRSPPGDTPLTAQFNGGSIPIAANGFFQFNALSSGTFISTYFAIDSAGRASIDPGLLKIVVLPEPPPPPPPGGGGGSAWGDPHFVSFDGLYYNMQGWGEFILTRATSGQTFEVQIRTKAWVPGAQVTIVEAVAAAIGNHRIMAHVDGTVLVDGVPATLAVGADPLLLTGNVRLHRPREGTYVFVDHDTGEQVRVDGVGSGANSAMGYLNVRPFVAASRADAMEGLLGDYNGNRADDIQLADGTVLAQPVNIFDLYGLFAADWRVTDANSLFVYGPGQGTSDFQVLNFPPVPLRISELPTALVAAAAAQVAAAGITDPFLAEAAILDILLTGDPAFIQGAQGAADPEEGLDVFIPPAPPLIGLASPLAAVAEGNDGDTATLTFTVFRTGNAADEVSVDWTVQALGVGFTDAADHGGTLPSGTVMLGVGETEKTFTVTVTGDAVPELNEAVRIALTTTPVGYVVASGTAQGTVLNDDGPVLPDAIDDSVATATDTPVVIAPLANDIDPIGTGLSVSAVGAAANGTVQRTGNQVIYTPNPGFSGQDSFTYTVQLGGAGAGTDTATITVLVAPSAPPPNTPPVAGTDAANAIAGVELAILPAQLLANDSDANNDPLGVAGIVQAPQNGTAQYIPESGVILYIANAGFSGIDTIIYALSDGQATTPGIINITVAAPPAGNGAPVAVADSFTGDEDTQITGNVLANDSDPDGDPLTAALVGGVLHGILVLNPDGSFTYTPAPDYFGPDSFTYRASDGTASGNIATVSLTVTPVNDPPTADNGSVSTPEDTFTSFNLFTVLNAFDVEGTLSVVSVSPSALGSAVVDPSSGLFEFQPNPDATGSETLEVVITDGDVSLARALTITVTPVNDAPVNLVLSNSSVAEDAAVGTVVGLLSATDVDGDPLVYSIAGAPGPFTIVGNQLRVAGPLDFETAPSHALTLVATDPSGAGTQLAATITITDVPEQPPGDLGFRFSNGSFGAGIGQLGPLLFTGFTVTQGGGRTFVENIGPWNAIKIVASPLIGWSAALGAALTFANFVEARMDFRNAAGQDLDLTFVGARRGEAHAADGDDRIEVVFHSDGGADGDVFLVRAGAGDDVVLASSVADSPLDDALLADNADPANGSLWDPAYDGRRSVIEVHAGAGDDVVIATDVRLIARGGTGSDLLQGGIRDDRLAGEAGNDVILAGAGNDRVEGGDGADLLDGEAGDDTIFAGPGNDVILGGEGDDRLHGQAGNDTIFGGDGRDRIQGGDGDDAIDGGEGDDVLLGQAGNDRIDGGAGNDFIDGGDGDDVLDGGAGNDVIIGGAGNDRIKGGTGQDYLTGGDGEDVFVLANRAADRDWITDFLPGTDRLESEAALFGAGLAPGALDPGRLVVGANPVAGTPGLGQFLFNTSNGILRWDADGAGGAAPQVIVTLTGVSSLAASDFIIV
jgi:Ca2+-binding RTX toxin-like protein